MGRLAGASGAVCVRGEQAAEPPPSPPVPRRPWENNATTQPRIGQFGAHGSVACLL